MYKYKGKKIGRKILFIILISIFAITASQSFIKAQGQTQTNCIEYTVYKGDTIWSIAQKHNIYRDVREMVYEIKKINNNTDSLILPGEVIKIPIK